MIYLFDRLYLESDHYIRNDKDSLTALLGASAVEAKSCQTLKYDFGKIKLTESVDNQNLAQYLKDLLAEANGQRVVVYTDDATLIKILAFYCSSIFKGATANFVKDLILLDKLWIDLSPGVTGHKDFALRHKGTDVLDVSNIDSLIAEGMAIVPKISGIEDVRIEYTFAGYINNTLSAAQKSKFEQKMKEIFYDTAWFGDLIKTFGPEFLTLAHKKGVNLDTFTIDTLRSALPKYFKIFDTSQRGDPTCFDRVGAQDCINFIDQAKSDFGWNYQGSLTEFINSFYQNKQGFVNDKVLTPENSSDYYCAMNLGKMIKANPYLWYSVAGSKDNKAYLDKFTLNV